MQRHRNELTRPRRCDAVVLKTDDAPEHSCKKRVFKAGMCIEHYNEWRNAREWRRENVTRRKRMVMDGITYYSTRAIDKAEGGKLFAMDTEQCVGKYGRCPKRPIINYEKHYYCQSCFMKEQRGLAVIAKKAEQKAAA